MRGLGLGVCFGWCVGSGMVAAQGAEPGPGNVLTLAAAGPALVALSAASASAQADAAQAAAWRPPLDFASRRWGPSTPAAATPRVSVVEVEADLRPGIAPGRARHALRMRAEWPRAALRSMGLATAECTTQIRMPSSIGQGGSLEVSAQVRLACRY